MVTDTGCHDPVELVRVAETPLRWEAVHPHERPARSRRYRYRVERSISQNVRLCCYHNEIIRCVIGNLPPKSSKFDPNVS